MRHYLKLLSVTLFISLLLQSCSDDYLVEVPVDQFSPENVLENKAGYQAAVVSLYEAARQEHLVASSNYEYMTVGTDLSRWGRYDSRGNKDYTLLSPTLDAAAIYWDWAYEEMVVRANFILDGIDKVDFDATERDNIKGQALFFRAYTYNFLANIYGGVPIVDKRLTQPKFDFVRNTRLEVLNFIKNDLEQAAQLLPVTVPDGRVPKAAAYHLLSEVYISLGLESGDKSYYDKSIEAATKVISKQVGAYELMTSRFGATSSKPGDVFSDLHAQGQINRSSGNKEVIFAWQMESFAVGGGTGNNWARYWGPEYDKIVSPNGFANSSADSLLRGIGVNSPTNFVKYSMWALDWKDMRNSEYNIRRTFYYNNPNDKEYYGKPIKVGRAANGKLYVLRNDGVTFTTRELDTLRQYYPWIKKIDGAAFNNDVAGGRSSKDITRMRVAETYLLRAEAYLRKGDLALAAADINTIRARAKAVLIAAKDVTEDFILDERARELLVEEPRLRTLIRMGRLVDRVRKYNSAPDTPGGVSSGNTIRDHNKFWPIPQHVIDANTQGEFKQNPGYPGAK